MNFTFTIRVLDNKILVPIKNHSTDLSTDLQYKLIRIMNNNGINNNGMNSEYNMINRIQNGGKCLACNK